jgi:hypothetical protein
MINDSGTLVFALGHFLNTAGPSGNHSSPMTTNAADVIGGIAADAGHYYFTVSNDPGGAEGVASLPKDFSGVPTYFALPSGTPTSGWFGLALGGSTLYATLATTTSAAGNVLEISTTTGAASLMNRCPVSGFCVWTSFGVAADPSGAFFSGSYGRVTSPQGAILAIPAGGVDISASIPTSYGGVSAPATPFPVALDATYVYWADATNAIVQAARTGQSASRTLTTAQSAVEQLAVSGGFVYFTTAGGVVARVSTGATPTVETLASASKPWGIAVRGSDVYWTTLDGAVEGVVLPLQ